ncbi:hypothetical protein JCM10212_002685 [Sporobolomyces blumeae]
MLASAGQIAVLASLFAFSSGAPALSSRGSPTLEIRGSASTPVAALGKPQIAPLDSLRAIFGDDMFPPAGIQSSASASGVSSSASSIARSSVASLVTTETSTLATDAKASISTVPEAQSSVAASLSFNAPVSTFSPLSAVSSTALSASASSFAFTSSESPASPESTPSTTTSLATASPLPSSGADVVARALLGSEFDLNADELFKRGQFTNSTFAARRKARLASMCLGTGTNETTINALLYYGGPGTTVRLCPHAQININAPIFFFAKNQVITTAGEPTGKSRATINVQGANQACAIYGAYPGADNVILRNVQVNGNRPSLGIIWGGLGLLEFGGNTVGQVIQNVRAYEPRGWTSFHSAEGHDMACSGMQIIGNQMGPSGHAPSGVNQFRRRDTGTWAPGQWADGISHACKDSVVSNNVITDATDGAIVVFGAPGSTISGNTIIADQRVAMGGINAVDWAPYGGTYEGTVIKNNKLIAQNSMIKVGIAIGGMVWGVDNRTAARTWGGSFIDNTFTSGPKGYFAYAIGVSGHKGATITGNRIDGANFGGVDSPSCFTNWFPLPQPQPFVADPYTTPESTFQDGFWLKTVLVLLICKGPGAILSRISSG